VEESLPAAGWRKKQPGRNATYTKSETLPKTQIWTALIAMLVLKYLHLKSKCGWSFSNLVALVRQQLFVYRDLWIWLDDPFQAPPALVGVHDQLSLEF
jgi:hypothetical protein